MNQDRIRSMSASASASASNPKASSIVDFRGMSPMSRIVDVPSPSATPTRNPNRLSRQHTPMVYPALLSRVAEAFRMRIALTERVKDGLRGWVGGRWVGEWSRRKAEREREGEGERVGVGRLVRRFSRRGDVGDGNGREGRWGKKRGGEREEPARAKVLGLRRFWEGVGRDGGSY